MSTFELTKFVPNQSVMTNQANETIMDYTGFTNQSAQNTLSQVNDLKINNFTSPKTPGFKTAARKEANKSQFLITELEQSGTQERMCPTVDSCSRLVNETQFQLSKKLYQLNDAVA